MYTIDCGSKGVLYNSENSKIIECQHEELLEEVLKLPPGSKVVGEDAHFGRPRKELSRAQLYTEKQLLSWYDECEKRNIQIKLFSQQFTGEARKVAEVEKSNENDAMAIAVFLGKYPEFTLKNPPKSFDASTTRELSYKFKSKTNAILNVGRGKNKTYFNDKDDAISNFLVKHLPPLVSELSETTIDIFGLNNRYKSNRCGNKGDLNFNQVKDSLLYTIAALLIDHKGNLRKEIYGELPSWKFIKTHVLHMSSYHLKGGVARSNLTHHGMRHWTSEKISEELELDVKKFKKKRRNGKNDEKGNYVPNSEFTEKENVCYIKYRKQYTHAIREIFRKFREILNHN